MHIPKFLAKINSNHEPVIFERFKNSHRQWLSGFKPDTIVSVVIKKDSVVKIRSLEANNYYFGVVVKYVCQAFGYEPHEKDMVHEGLKFRFLTEEKVIGFPVTKSTAKMESPEFWDYIDTIKRWMSSEYNVYIPDPNEYDDINETE